MFRKIALSLTLFLAFASACIAQSGSGYPPAVLTGSTVPASSSYTCSSTSRVGQLYLYVNGTTNNYSLWACNNTSGSYVWTPVTSVSGTNCANAASPAVCGSSSAGAVVIAPAATTVVVNTTAVQASSRIFIVPDESATIASTTCNTTAAVALATFGVTARVAGTSFTITTTGTVATNPACYSYFIVN